MWSLRNHNNSVGPYNPSHMPVFYDTTINVKNDNTLKSEEPAAIRTLLGCQSTDRTVERIGFLMCLLTHHLFWKMNEKKWFVVSEIDWKPFLWGNQMPSATFPGVRDTYDDTPLSPTTDPDKMPTNIINNHCQQKILQCTLESGPWNLEGYLKEV